MQEEATGTTITGLPALLALLHHAHMYEHICLILNRFHADATVRSPAENAGEFSPLLRSIETDTSMASVAG